MRQRRVLKAAPSGDGVLHTIGVYNVHPKRYEPDVKLGEFEVLIPAAASPREKMEMINDADAGNS